MSGHQGEPGFLPGTDLLDSIIVPSDDSDLELATPEKLTKIRQGQRSNIPELALYLEILFVLSATNMDYKKKSLCGRIYCVF